MSCDLRVVMKGGGDVGSGVAHRLHHAGMRVLITELPQPMVIRRAVSFASAVYDGAAEVEGVRARRARSLAEALNMLTAREITVLVDPEAEVIAQWRPDVVVDALMAKRNTGTGMTDAPVVIGLGPGFEAGVDVHAVVETKRGHTLGRVIVAGTAHPDTGAPEEVSGYTYERVIYAPQSGVFQGCKGIGDKVEAGEVVGYLDGEPVAASIPGVLRGLLADGLLVPKGTKVGDVDPTGVVEHCFTISDRARAIGGGVLEAILYLRGARQ